MAEQKIGHICTGSRVLAAPWLPFIWAGAGAVHAVLLLPCSGSQGLPAVGLSPIGAPCRGWSCPTPTPAVGSLAVPIWIIFPLCSDHLQPSPPLFSSPLSRVSDSPPAKGWSSTVNREQLQAGPAPATSFSLPVPSQELQSLLPLLWLLGSKHQRGLRGGCSSSSAPKAVLLLEPHSSRVMGEGGTAPGTAAELPPCANRGVLEVYPMHKRALGTNLCSCTPGAVAVSGLWDGGGLQGCKRRPSAGCPSVCLSVCPHSRGWGRPYRYVLLFGEVHPLACLQNCSNFSLNNSFPMARFSFFVFAWLRR